MNASRSVITFRGRNTEGEIPETYKIRDRLPQDIYSTLASQLLIYVPQTYPLLQKGMMLPLFASVRLPQVGFAFSAPRGRESLCVLP